MVSSLIATTLAHRKVDSESQHALHPDNYRICALQDGASEPGNERLQDKIPRKHHGTTSSFNENQTLLRECTSKDALSHMSTLCTTIKQRYIDLTPEDRWEHVVNSLNEALLKRIQARTTAKSLSPSAYGLKSEDFCDAQHAAKLRSVNLANSFAVARELDMAENPDGIMVRRHVALPAQSAQSVRSSDATSLRLSTTNQRISQPASNQPPRPTAAPSGPFGVPGRQLHKTYFDDPRHSDLTIVLGDRSVHAHRVVLSRVSEYFDLLFENNHRVCQNR